MKGCILALLRRPQASTHTHTLCSFSFTQKGPDEDIKMSFFRLWCTNALLLLRMEKTSSRCWGFSAGDMCAMWGVLQLHLTINRVKRYCKNVTFWSQLFAFVSMETSIRSFYLVALLNHRMHQYFTFYVFAGCIQMWWNSLDSRFWLQYFN